MYFVIICDRVWENRSYSHINWNPVFVHKWKAHSCTTKYLAIDGQVCFYRRLFADAIKPRRCISWSWGALIGLHGVPNCSSRQSGPPLWMVPVHVIYWRHSTALWVWMGILPRLRLSTRPHHPPTPLPPTPLPPTHTPPTPYRINPWYYRSWKKTSSIQVRSLYIEIAIKS